MLLLLSVGLVLGFCSAHLLKIAADDECRVQFGEEGEGFGSLKRTFNGTQYCEFLGIRYAEPPVGKLRFENPVPRYPSGVQNYSKLGPICPQLDDLNYATAVLGDEDCLFLDIYRPMGSLTSNLPVLVFIHGGSFAVGSTTSDFYGVDLIMDQEVIVVSAQYRLDPLGFLLSNSFNISGNFGLKDQRTALQWVQQHIRCFGGDPSRVTLMGHSAGAASVTYHLYSSSSSGLFQQAFVLGGSMLAPWAFLYDADSYSSRYFQDLNLTTIEQLKSVDFKTFWDKDIVYKFATVSYGFCVPSAELESPDAFITQSPQELIRKKPVNTVPLLFGQSSEEFELFLSYVHSYWMGENFPNIQNETLKQYIGSLVDRAAEMAERSGIEINRDIFYLELANTANWFFPNKFLITEYSKWLPESTYYFRFQFDGKFGRFKQEFHDKLSGVKHYGAIHGDELGYIFTPYNIADALTNRSAFHDELRVHEKTVELVTNFVKFGNPNQPNTVPTWPAYNGADSNPQYLNIDREFEVQSDRQNLYHAFWQIIYRCLYYYNCEGIVNLLQVVGRMSK
ncbi:carboxylic ester hydrolase-like [Uranotaenia lowii]|uniref:carboxylic ester hydrolase-like n=1 Tax=Uranotaenia lowii TaxID=190385 RepID=UPI002478AA1E|nr:carboxylic ester hydrolase-like [Uranotaenia lowii]